MNPEDIEEERRLCYVGITRAKKQLEIHGKRSSIFIQEIHNILEPKKKVRSETKTAHESQLSINDLTEGLVIRHTKYGEGYIEQYDESQIHVVFFNGPSRKLSTSFCLNNGIIYLAE